MKNAAVRPLCNIGKAIALLCMSFASLCHAQTSAEGAPATNAELPAVADIAPAEIASSKMQEPLQEPVMLASAAPSSQPISSLVAPLDQQQAQIDKALSDSLATDAISPEKKAMTAAVADGITTGLALSLGAAESNPVIGGSPLGIVAATGVKFALLKYADSMPQEQKRFTLKASSAVWGGAAVNNVLVLLAAPPPAPLIAGLLMGFFTWKQMADQYDEEDRIAAARQKEPTQSQEDAVATLTDRTESSGQ